MMSPFLLFAFLALAGGGTSSEVSQVAHQFFANKQATLDPRIQEREMIQHSAHGTHISYQRSYNHIPIVEHRPKSLHLSQDLKQVLAYHLPANKDHFPLFRKFSPQQRDELLKSLNEKHHRSYKILAESPFYWDSGKRMHALYRFRLQGKSEFDQRYVEVDSHSHKIVNDYNPNFEYETGSGQVLRHNPIAASQQKGDPSLYSQVPLLGLDGSGYLRGSYVDVAIPELIAFYPPSRYAPDYLPGAAFEPSFTYSYLRDDLRYEEVAAYFWIDTAQRYLLSKGQHIANYQTKVNVHAFEGTNAFFFPSNQAIYLGDGYVDTAEDSSVITHEYGHAVLHDIIRNLPYDLGRDMLHEGFADFFAYLIASESTDAVGPDRYPHLLGEWFASNEQAATPYLRSLLAPGFTYPFLSYEPHADGQLWSSTFYELAQELGNDTALTIILEGLYLADSASPRVVAQALLDAEQQVYEGAHHEVLTRILRARGLYETEDYIPALELVEGQSLTIEDRTQLLRFTAPDSEQLQLHLSSSENTISILGLTMGRVESLGYAGRADVVYQPNTTWVLSAKSTPELVAGATYYLLVQAKGSLTIELEQKPAEAALEAQANTAYAYQVASDHVNYYHLSQLGDAKRVLIQSTHEPGHLLYLGISDSDFDPYDPYRSPAQTVVLNQNGYTVLDLADLLPNASELYLSLSNPLDSFEGSFTWQALGPLETKTLVRDEYLELTLREPWNNSWRIEFNENIPNLLLEADLDHPFQLSRQDSFFRLNSTLSNGKQRIRLAPSDQLLFIPGYGPYPSDFATTIGAYDIHFDGESGQTVSLTAHAPAGSYHLLAMGDTLHLPLGPNELVHYQFALPENAQDVRLQLLGGADSGLIAFIYREGHPETVLTALLSASSPRYRASSTSLNLALESNSPPVEPGYTYELLLLNVNENQEPTLKIDTGPVQVPAELVSGMQVTLPNSGSDYLIGSNAYLVPMQMNPPAGTKRIALHFDEQSGSSSVKLVHHGNLARTAFYLVDTILNRFNLGFVPDHAFTLYFRHDLQSGVTERPSFRVTIEYLTDTDYHVALNADISHGSNTLASNTDLITQLEIPAGTRQVDYIFNTDSELETLGTLSASQGQEKPFDRTDYTSVITYQARFSRHPASVYDALPLTPWYLHAHLDDVSQHQVGYNSEALPLSVDMAVRYRSQNSQIERKIPTEVGTAQVVEGRQRYHNPSGQERTITLTQGEQVESHTVAAHGFLAVTMAPGDAMIMNADGPLVLSEGLQGEGFLTNAAGPAFLGDKVVLPHVSPDASDWTAYCLAVGPSVISSAFINSPGTFRRLRFGNPVALENSGNVATWRNLETGTVGGQYLPELAMAPTLFWQNQNQLVEEIPPTEAARTFFVPHLPDNPAWWSGLTLSNPNKESVDVRILAYGPDGAMARTVSFMLAANGSKAELMSAYIDGDYSTGQLSWLRIEASQPILSMEFMGGLHTGDTAGFVLPSQDGNELVLPGNLNETPFGVALVNTVNQAGSCTLIARDPNGAVLSQQTFEMKAFERKLITDNSLNIPAGQAYSLEAVTGDLRLVGMQLDNDATGRLAATAAQMWH